MISNVALEPACAWLAPATAEKSVGKLGAEPDMFAVAITPLVAPPLFSLAIVIVASLVGLAPPNAVPETVNVCPI